MAVIIGSATNIVLRIPAESGTVIGCVLSVNWSYNPNIQRYYCLGSNDPYITITKPTEQMSVVLYSGSTPSYPIAASESCDDLGGSIFASVDPGDCAEAQVQGPIKNIWYLQNYGFSKDDPNLPGQETWALTHWLSSADFDAAGIPSPTGAAAPNRVLRGIPEGQASDYNAPADDADPGVEFTGDTQYATTGNVSAGQIGRADTLFYGVADAVGNSGQLPTEADQYGRTGQGSVSVPLSPVWF